MNSNKLIKNILLVLITIASFSFLMFEEVKADNWEKVRMPGDYYHTDPGTSFSFFDKLKGTYTFQLGNNTYSRELVYSDLQYRYSSYNGDYYRLTYLYNEDPTVYVFSNSNDNNLFLDIANDGSRFGTVDWQSNYRLFFPSEIYENRSTGNVIFYTPANPDNYIKLTLDKDSLGVLLHPNFPDRLIDLCYYNVDPNHENLQADVADYMGGSAKITLDNKGVFQVIITKKINGVDVEEIITPFRNHPDHLYMEDNNILSYLGTIYKGDCPASLNYNPPPNRQGFRVYDNIPTGFGKKWNSWIRYEFYDHKLFELKEEIDKFKIIFNHHLLCVQEWSYDQANSEFERFQQMQSTRTSTYNNNINEQITNEITDFMDELKGHLLWANDCLINKLENDTEKSEEEKERELQKLQGDAEKIEELYESFVASINNLSFDYKNDPDLIQCDALLGTETVKMLNYGFLIIQIGAVVLTIILGILDFTKATVSFEEDAMKKSFTTFIKRIIACVILIISPLLVTFILEFFSIPGIINTNPLCK